MQPVPAKAAFPAGVKRIAALAALFAAELLVITIALDGNSLPPSGLTGVVRCGGTWTLRCIAGFAAIFATFVYLREKDRIALQPVYRQMGEAQFRPHLLAAHLAAMAAFGGLSVFMYGGTLRGSAEDLLAAAWLAAGLSGIVLACLAFFPARLWTRLVRSAGYLWVYALAAVMAGAVTGRIAQLLWRPACHLTFAVTKLILSVFISAPVANPKTMTLGTKAFWVVIDPLCSGLEGVGLILAFSVLWLLLFRHETRFPQALLLPPAGVLLIFLLNATRLAAMVLIGNLGVRKMAAGGFHSQAGWIMFNIVAVGFCVAIRHVSWFAAAQPVHKPVAPQRESLADNPTAAYLTPFLAILAAGMIAGAAAAGFEWLYPLRLAAAAGALWLFRRSYAALDWKFDWVAPAAGAAVFMMWIGLDRLLWASAAPGAPWALKGAPEGVRLAWIVMRALAAVVTVPIAEELAFRGFLLRRLAAADFESVAFSRVEWPALAISSAAFGLLHGGYWPAGVVAGAIFGLLAMRRGRIGDAVAAHATANGLLAAYVLISGRWQLW